MHTPNLCFRGPTFNVGAMKVRSYKLRITKSLPRDPLLLGIWTEELGLGGQQRRRRAVAGGGATLWEPHHVSRQWFHRRWWSPSSLGYWRRWRWWTWKLQGVRQGEAPHVFFAILHASGKPWCGALGLVSDEYFYTLKSNTRMTNICTSKVVGISRRLSLHRIGSQESCQLGPCLGIINMWLMFLHSIQLSMYHHFL
jgi:hypothetical protein